MDDEGYIILAFYLLGINCLMLFADWMFILKMFVLLPLFIASVYYVVNKISKIVKPDD